MTNDDDRVPTWRCTRPDAYTAPGCPGHDNVRARQGYYVTAPSERAARAVMARDFPRDSGFDIETWLTWDAAGNEIETGYEHEHEHEQDRGHPI